MRRKKLNYRKVLTLFLLLILGIGFSWGFQIFKNNKPADNKQDPIVEEEEEEKEEPKEKSLKMLMVGDVLIHGNVYNDAKVDSTYDFSPMFDDIRDIVKQYDLAFYNQETPFGGKELKYSGYPTFNTPSEIGDEMIEMGFNLVSLATNHTMDKGEKGALNSLNYWKEKENVLVAGSYASTEERNKEVIKEKNGITYTMLAYTTLTNYAIPSGKSYLLNMYDKTKVKEDIERVRNKVDLLLVSMHWGVEYANTPSSQQKEIAAYLASLGVDIIIGHHTHSVQPIEFIDNTLVIYSMGNFISSQLNDDDLIGLMSTLKITKKEIDGESIIEISDVQADLVFTYYKGGRTMGSVHTNHKVIPFDKLTVEDFPRYKYFYEKYKKVLTSMDETIEVGAINE